VARRAPRGRDVPGSSSVRLGQHFVMPGVNEFTLLDQSPAYSARVGAMDRYTEPNRAKPQRNDRTD